MQKQQVVEPATAMNNEQPPPHERAQLSVLSSNATSEMNEEDPNIEIQDHGSTAFQKLNDTNK